MDSNEPTAWEDINPMVSAPRRELPSKCSAVSLQPATSEQFRNELAACLTLVAPVGMTEEARRDWFAVAWTTLGHLPPDLLSRGCRVARERCDHPSKIVPTILDETKQSMMWRREATVVKHTALPKPRKRSVIDRRGEAMSEDETAELNGILENLGATARYRSDGSRYLIDQE